MQVRPRLSRTAISIEKHLKLKQVTKRFTFVLAMLSSRFNCMRPCIQEIVQEQVTVLDKKPLYAK